MFDSDRTCCNCVYRNVYISKLPCVKCKNFDKFLYDNSNDRNCSTCVNESLYFDEEQCEKCEKESRYFRKD